MDYFFEAIFGLFGAAAGSRRTPREQATSFFALCLFPLADLTILLVTNRYDEQAPSTGLPLVFALLTLALCRALFLPMRFTVVMTVGCGLVCFAASIAAVFLGIVLSVGL